MRYRFTRLALPAACVAALALPASSLHAQGNTGTVAITVQDASGAVIPDAKLDLVEKTSNSPRDAVSDGKGLHNFVDLNIGTYRLTVSHDGFQTKVYENVLVESSTTTPLIVVLPAGQVTETVNVETQANAVLQTSSTEIGTVINTTDIENLPIAGRSINSLTSLTAGYNGTWNGLPEGTQGTNIDGIVANNGRTKYQGTISPGVSPRVESFEQVSVVTDGLNLGNGFGTATTQLNYISRRGSNQFHGRAYYDFRNSGLNANSWANDSTLNSAGQYAPTRKAKLILHDFGVSVGGPIIKNKLFFFGTYAESKQPGTTTVTNNIFPAASIAGNFTYAGTDGTAQHPVYHTVNVFQLAQQYSPTLPGVINPAINTLIQNAVTASQGLSITQFTDPTIEGISFAAPSPVTMYFPVARLDYNVNDKLRMYMSWLMTQSNPVGSYPAPFPGPNYASQAGNNFTRTFNMNYGLDYIVTPRLINQFKFGFLYSDQQFAATAAPNWYGSQPPVFFNMTGDTTNNRMSGLNYSLPSGYEYPVFSLSDSVSLEKGSHSMNFGFQGYREQDHYYNPPVGFANINLGLATGDPAANAFTVNGTLPNSTTTNQAEAQQLYAVLTGRISSVSGSNGYDTNTHAYGPHSFNLDDLALASGVWAQDSWKAFKTLTLNYGLRWDFVTATHDVRASYHNALIDSIYGPTAQGALFQPGTLGGNLNPVFSLNPRPFGGFYKTPQPQVGLAWNPDPEKGTFMDRLLGGHSTVIRAGFGLRNFTEPYQFFWDAASAQALLYYQSFGLTANTTGATGTYTPGSLAYGQPFPAYAVNPVTFPTTAPEVNFTFINGGTTVEGIKSNIHMPYTESWNFGIQRALARSTVLELRYNGNRSVHVWNTYNYNEVNIFENGFLGNFQAAQRNLAINTAAGIKNDFSNHGGGPAMPIISAVGAVTPSIYTNATFITYLNTGAAGSFARQLAGSSQAHPEYFCPLVGAAFAPCKNANQTYAGAGYPINFFQANPYAPGSNTAYMTDGGYSNYNGLQIDLRQANWHGLQGDANYTFSKTLGFGTNNNDYLATTDNFYTLRNLHLAYSPQSFDIRNVFHGFGTYDLPFGKGKAFMNQNALANEVVGGITIGTVVGYQSGTPFIFTGGYDTFNQYDGGVTLNGTTASALQSKVGIHHIAGHSTSLAFDPSLYSGGAAGGTANTAILAPNTTPGTIGSVVWLHGPNQFTQNMSVTKSIPIKEGIGANIQAEFINVWNHPVWGSPSTSNTGTTLTNSNFGTSSITVPTMYSGTGANGARQIELRANIYF